MQHVTVHQSATKTVREVLLLWNQSRIPATKDYNAIRKLENLVETYKNLKANWKTKKSIDAQRRKETLFTDELQKLFDIAHANAMKLMNIDEDKQFLLDQR